MKETVLFWGSFPNDALQELHNRLGDRFRCVEMAAGDSDIELLQSAHCILLRGPKMPAKVLDICKENLRLIQRWGAGYDGIDSKHAEELGINVAIASGVNANAVAELTLGMLFSIYRNIVPLHSQTVAGVWDAKRYAELSYEIQGKTVGLLGCGHIGRLVAKKMGALGAKVIYYDPYPLSKAVEEEFSLEWVEQDALLTRADIVSLHLPANEKTIGMVNAQFLNKMKPTAVLLNAARGSLVNEADLANALQSGRILGAGLDCLSTEPPAKDNPLLSCKNLLLTPHVGGTSVDVNGHMVDRVAQNIVSFFEGKPLMPGDLVVGKGL